MIFSPFLLQITSFALKYKEELFLCQLFFPSRIASYKTWPQAVNKRDQAVESI